MRPGWVDGYLQTLPDSTRRVICAGNSLTAGTGASNPATTAYPPRLATRLGAPWAAQNCGVGGQTTGDMITAIASQEWPYASVTGRNVVVVWEGSNDLAGLITPASTTVAACEARLVQLCGLFRVWQNTRVVVANVISRRNGAWSNGDWTEWEAARQAFNAWLAASWSTFADAFCDLAADAAFSAPTAYSNLTYYNADQVHMTDAGYDLVASLVQPYAAAFA